jgi:hypothetical protein
MKATIYLCLCLSLVNLAFVTRLLLSRRPVPPIEYSASWCTSKESPADPNRWAGFKGNDFPVNLVETTKRVSLTVEESAHYPLVDETSWSYWTTIAPLGFGLNTVEDRIFSVAMFHEVRNDVGYGVNSSSTDTSG